MLAGGCGSERNKLGEGEFHGLVNTMKDDEIQDYFQGGWKLRP